MDFRLAWDTQRKPTSMQQSKTHTQPISSGVTHSISPNISSKPSSSESHSGVVNRFMWLIQPERTDSPYQTCREGSANVYQLYIYLRALLLFVGLGDSEGRQGLLHARHTVFPSCNRSLSILPHPRCLHVHFSYLFRPGWRHSGKSRSTQPKSVWMGLTQAYRPMTLSF